MERCVDKWSAQGVSWRHIPPFAHSKGVMVGLSKNLINTIATRDFYRSITTEDLITYFIKEVEGILNWRPLTSVSSKTKYFCFTWHILKTESLKKS